MSSLFNDDHHSPLKHAASVLQYPTKPLDEVGRPSVTEPEQHYRSRSRIQVEGQQNTPFPCRLGEYLAVRKPV